MDLIFTLLAIAVIVVIASQVLVVIADSGTGVAIFRFILAIIAFFLMGYFWQDNGSFSMLPAFITAGIIWYYPELHKWSKEVMDIK